MGSSKIVFVGAVAVIIGLFGYGIKKAEKKSADIAIAHAYLLQAKTLAEEGLQVAARKLPANASAVNNRSFDKTTKDGTYGYTATKDGMPAGQVKVTSYGIMNGQKTSMVSILQELPPGPKPTGVKAWNRWKLLSSTRTFATIDQ